MRSEDGWSQAVADWPGSKRPRLLHAPPRRKRFRGLHGCSAQDVRPIVRCCSRPGTASGVAEPPGRHGSPCRTMTATHAPHRRCVSTSRQLPGHGLGVWPLGREARAFFMTWMLYPGHVMYRAAVDRRPGLAGSAGQQHFCAVERVSGAEQIDRGRSLLVDDLLGI